MRRKYQISLQSLRKLNNKYLEIILVDNGSKDLTYKHYIILEKNKVEYKNS